ncbi:MAG TPA: YdjY domain-containing protein [Verrucomicrobiae bacterium]|nr:YdjY domain-containing protein [Verrucomicrobiae bacterium]
MALPFVFLVCALLPRSASAAETNSVRQVGPGIYEIGLVRVDAIKRQLTIPTQVNMLEGPIEYVLVSAIGKLHESIFKTDAQPVHIHTAALLLLKEPIKTNEFPKIRVSVELPSGKNASADSLILDVNRQKRLLDGDWQYLGSRMVEGTFIAQRDGSILSIIADPDSLMQTGRISADDDDRWRPAKTDLPPIGAPVKLTLQF